MRLSWSARQGTPLPTKEERGFLPASSQQKAEGTQAGTASESDDERSLFIMPLPRAAPVAPPSLKNLNADDLAISEVLLQTALGVRERGQCVDLAVK